MLTIVANLGGKEGRACTPKVAVSRVGVPPHARV